MVLIVVVLLVVFVLASGATLQNLVSNRIGVTFARVVLQVNNASIDEWDL